MIQASDLVAAVQRRYPAGNLKAIARVAIDDDLTARLTEKSVGVVSRVRAAIVARIGWPIPGIWDVSSPSPFDSTVTVAVGTLYADVWPGNLTDHAIGLVLWRLYDGYEGISIDIRKIGEAHEQYFNDLESGKVGLGVGGDTDKGPDYPVAARDFSGNALIPGIPDRVSITTKFDGDPFWEGAP
jgi:hypothetical protein